MGAHQVIAVIIRLFAIGVIFYVVNNLPNTVFIYQHPEAMHLKTYALTVGAATLLLAVLLWIFPNAITKHILPSDSNLKLKNVDKDNFLSLSLIILGVYFLYYSIGDLIFWGVMIYSDFVLELDQKVNIIVTILEFVVSLFLIFGSRGIANLIIKIRGR